MNPIDKANNSLERIELTLKSIDYQLTMLTNLIAAQRSENDTVSVGRDPAMIPEMITIREASRRTGLSYDFLRKECIRDNLVHVRVGNGKRLINYGRLTEQLELSHGSIQKK